MKYYLFFLRPDILQDILNSDLFLYLRIAVHDSLKTCYHGTDLFILQKLSRHSRKA